METLHLGSQGFLMSVCAPAPFLTFFEFFFFFFFNFLFLLTNIFFFVDGSLYIHLPDSVIFPGEELSQNCSEVVTFVEGVGPLGENCRISWVFGNILKMSFPELHPDDIIDIALPGSKQPLNNNNNTKKFN